MLALAATNLTGAALFAALYAAAGARLLPQGAFVASLLLLFSLLTTAWLRVERRQGLALGSAGRVGRVVAGLALVLFGAPALVLAPLFALESRLPAEAGLADVIRPVMVLLLASLLLTVLVNVVGVAVIVARGVLARAR